MKIGTRVRKIYERHPYPPPSLREERAVWPLPAMEWINALWERKPENTPARILVAGCGVGTEAFAIAQRFPEADVVGVDFSPRSIATAKRLRRRTKGGERVSFEVADLADSGLTRITGDHFDLISCHGVLSYIPETVPVLRNLARCLTPAGILILGVNGASHPSARWRPLLAGFGIDTDEFREGTRVRDVIRVCESLTAYPPIPMAHRDAGYLAGDLFGPLNRALPLAEWTAFCREVGLHLRGSYHAYFAIRTLLNHDLHSLLMPRSRAEVGELVDEVQPTSFHQLVLSRRRPAAIPWSDGREMLRRRPFLTSLHSIRWPRRGGSWHTLRDLTLESPATHTLVTLRIPQWEVEILRESDGERSLGEILRGVTPRVPAKPLSEAMYLLYQLGVVNLLQPARV